MKALIVVDMQNDFINGSLGTKEAEAIVPKVVEKIDNWVGPIICTCDHHDQWYLSTLEGEQLPVEHCIHGSNGYELNDNIKEILLKKVRGLVEKRTFGYDWNSANLPLKQWLFDSNEIEMVGLCTDVCVVSNAIILRAMFPNKKITVDASCCAGVTPEKHKAALEVMKSCQIDVINE